MSTWVGIVTKRIRDLITSPVAEMNRWQRVARYSIELGRHCYRQLVKDRANQMAAALTYHTLFSLIPTLVLMLVVGRLFVGEAELETFRESTVEYVLKWLQESAGAMAAGAEAQAMASQQEFADTAIVVSEQIDHWLGELQNINFGAIGAVGVLLFIYGATGLLTTIERSFNRICDAPANRPLFYRLPMYYTVITLGPLLLVLGQFLQNRVIGWLYGGITTVTEQIGEETAESTGIGWIARTTMTLIVLLMPLVSTWVVITATYVLLPNTKVRLRPAMIGAIVAAIGTVASIELFGLYVRGAVATTLYGPLALLPLFLLWLYLIWLVVLFGLELANALQTLPSERMKMRDRSQEQEMIIDPAWVIPALAAAAEAFEAGGKITPDQIARRTALPSRATTRLAAHLHTSGLLNRIDGPGQNYSLARPASKIELRTILDVGRALATTPLGSDTPGVSLLRQLNQAEDQSLEGKTLADVLAATPKSSDG